MNVQRVLGEFPVFAKDAKLGKRTNVNGNVLPTGSTQAFADSNKLAYETGTDNLTPEMFNGALNYVTANMSYLFHRGVPEYSLNVAYSKGSIVTFDGALYVSLTDDNIKHVSQTSHWGRFTIEENDSKHNKYPRDETKAKDSNPIGTILTVPVNAELDGYIDYVEGKEFNTTIYPELYKALGTNRFGYSKEGSNELPLGSLVHILSTEQIPEGWLEWSPYVSLAQYPDLYLALSRMVEQMPMGTSKQVWVEALREQRLPMFSNTGFHIGMKGNVGEFIQDKVKQDTLMSYPVVVDESNSLNPIGVSRCAVEHQEQVVGAVISQKQYMSSVASPLVLVAHKSEQHRNVDAKMVVVQEDVVETVPKTLSTRLIIKATNQRPSSISNTHKQVIKYVN